MSKKFLITKYQTGVLTALAENNEILEFNYEDFKIFSILGNIYVGKVKNVVQNIEAAFIEFGENQIGYYDVKENKNPIFLNSKPQNASLSCGDSILIQVSKEGIKTKAPNVTSNINLTGKYVVLTANIPYLSFSSKITDKNWRRVMREQLLDFVTEEYGFIIRTNAQNQDISIIQKEMKQLIVSFQLLLEQSRHRTAKALVYKAPAAYLTNLHNLYMSELEEKGILTDDKEIYDEAFSYLNTYQPEDKDRLCFYDDNLLPLKKLYNIEKELMRALSEKVFLKSGGYLIIQPTEALTVIDVNTGKFTKKKKLEDTALFINKEAAKEIAKQLRLRNISGIIIVDFINMAKQEHLEELMETFESYLKQDPIKTVLEGISKLNLVELTRKKIKKPLLEQMQIGKQNCRE